MGSPLLAVLLGSLFLPAGAIVGRGLDAQSVPAVRLSEAEATFHHGFTQVAGVRELRDGRVIVLDSAFGTVHVIDAGWLSLDQIGRRGAGPREYIWPHRLFALPGDSSAVYDQQNRRILVITPDAQPGGFLSDVGAATSCPNCRASTAGIRLSTPQVTDGRGNWYAMALPVTATPGGTVQVVDSMAIERWSTDAPRRDTVAFVPFAIPPGIQIVSRPGGRVVGLAYQPTGPPKAFRSSTIWAVAPDGRVAVVQPEPYQVVLFDPSGRRHEGSPIAYERERVNEGLKEQWREEQQRSRPMLVVTRDRRRSSPVMTPPAVEPEWPRYLPPFMYGAARFAPDGLLWVQRTTAADAPPTFDVIDERGNVIGRVQLLPNRRIVGFGRLSVYTVRVDEFDLLYLERYPLPVIHGN